MDFISLYSMYEKLEEKQLKKYFKKVADIIRKFPEYQIWSEAKKENVNRCQICNEMFDYEVVKPEVHHNEKTLTEIVEDEFYKICTQDKTTLDLVKFVLSLHLQDKVSFITICQCCHKKEHLKRKSK